MDKRVAAALKARSERTPRGARLTAIHVRDVRNVAIHRAIAVGLRTGSSTLTAKALRTKLGEIRAARKAIESGRG